MEEIDHEVLGTMAESLGAELESEITAEARRQFEALGRRDRSDQLRKDLERVCSSSDTSALRFASVERSRATSAGIAPAPLAIASVRTSRPQRARGPRSNGGSKRG